MHDLVPIQTGEVVLATDELDSLRGFAEAEKAASTREAYRKDFATFAAWALANGVAHLPAEPLTVARFISAQARAGLSVSSISRRLAGIAYAHKLRKLPNPCATDDVRVILAGIRRTLGTAPKRKQAATAERIRAMLDACPSSMIGTRDRAILALGFAGAFRRSELVALEVRDLTEVPDGYRVLIRRSKTDQTGEGQEVVIPRGSKIMPVRALQAWLERANITEGLLFRAVHRGGHLKPQGISGHDLAKIVKRCAKRAGLDPAELSGHSLRAGFATSAAESGATIFKIAGQTRHKSMDVLRHYVRSVDAFRDHAGSAFL
jgi:site-specific recombinase XerD